MRNIAVIAIAFALIVPAAFAQQVQVDYNQSQNFSHYRTYAWKGCSVAQNDPILRTGFTANRIQSAVDHQLNLKEMRQVPGDASPDVYFTCWMSETERSEIWVSGWGPGWGIGYWGWHGGWGGGWGAGYSSVNTSRYTEGVYVVDMVDAGNDQLVWRATASMTISNSQEDANKIERMARRAFKKFPAGPAASVPAVRPNHPVRPAHPTRG
jgi:uncharacterized protein DUF4136